MQFQLSGHSTRLQSLRGIAALCVAVGHSFTLVPNGRIEGTNFALRPTNAFLATGEILIQPNTAVIVFYVLSGFVLAEAFRRQRSRVFSRHILAFAARRIWRLVPVMWLSIVFAALVLFLVPHAPHSGATDWFNASINVDVTLAAVLTNLAGLSHSLNSVLWSIQIELVMIGLLPFMVLICDRTSLSADYAILCALCLISISGWDWFWNSILFTYCFYLGVMLPKVLSDEAAPRLLGNGIGILASLGLLLPIDYLYASHQLWMPYKFIADALISFHLIAFLMLRPNGAAISLLEQPILVWLGDISYSFYCYTMSVLIVTGSLVLAIVPISWLANDFVATLATLAAGASCVVISLALAQFSFKRIEMPGVRIGAAWSKWIEAGTLPPEMGPVQAPAERSRD
jgi:peptidoglycan/LPS O-acetylase OafA/YrhL